MNWALLAISISHFSHDIYTAFLSPILPLLIEKHALSYTLAGSLSIVLRLPTLLNPIFGLISDKVNSKYFVIFSPLVTAICMSLIGLSNSYYALVILLLIAGISSAMYHVPTPAIVKKIAKRPTVGMSSYMIGGQVARALGPLIVVWAVSVWGLEGMYRLVFIGFITSSFLFLSLKNLKPINKENKNTLKESLKNLFTIKKYFIGVLGVSITTGFTSSVLTAFMPTYLANKGYSISIAGSSASIIAVSGIIGISIAGYLSNKIGKIKVLRTINALSPILMISFFLLPDGIIKIPMLILTSIICLSATPVIISLTQDHGKKIPAFSNSIYMTIQFLSASLAVLIFGRLSDTFGLHNTFFISSGLATLGVIIVTFFSKNLEVNKNDH
jgi:MFS transporter, FSR family, fosmidomycin resistance protein